MNEKKWRIFFVLIFFLFPVLAFSSVMWMNSSMGEIEDDIRNLKNDISIYEVQNLNLEKRIKMYKEVLSDFQNDKLAVPGNEIELFSIVQRELTSNGVLSRVIGRSSREEIGSSYETNVHISFEGTFQAFVRTLADWRRLNVALRVKSLSLSAYGRDTLKGDILLGAAVGK